MSGSADVQCKHDRAFDVGPAPKSFSLGTPARVKWCGECGAICDDGAWVTPAHLQLRTVLVSNEITTSRLRRDSCSRMCLNKALVTILAKLGVEVTNGQT